MFNGIIQTILVAFSMKRSRAYTGMLSSENDDFKFLKTATSIKRLVHHAYHSSRAHGTVLSPNQSVVERKVAIQLFYIFPKISKFKYW